MIIAVVVIYNKRCSDSITLNCIKDFSKYIDIVVFDNSTKDYRNSNYCKDMGYRYCTLHNNVGLSKAYNYVVDNVKRDETDYFLILDDDTELSSDYLDEAVKLAATSNYDVNIPVVKTEKFILSPTYLLYGCRAVQIENFEDIRYDKLTAINSGMIVRGTVYEKIRYDENLFLDMVDHDFMIQVKEAGYSVNVMESEIHQNYSREMITSIDSAVFRFGLYKKDMYKFCVKYGKLWFYFINVWKLKIENCIKYKTFKFIFL